MTFKSRINKWLINFRKYLFIYRDGYYELPYLSNSPQIMLASFKKMSFVKFDEKNKCIKTKNPFTDGVMYYKEVEEGLWIMITEIEFKKNISTHALYDNEPCDYYFMSYFKYYHKLKDTKMNDIDMPNTGWGLYKPGTQVNSYFSEHDKGVFMDICFSKLWFDKNFGIGKMSADNVLKQYLDSDIAYKIWKDTIENGEERMNKILNALKVPLTDGMSDFSMKILCLDLMNSFFTSIVNMPVAVAEDKINETDRRHLANAERMLVNALTTHFPGIDIIATTVHMSPTKLKTLFKKVYGNSMMQYYQEKQILLALNILKAGKISVKEVANNLGYDNHSNFTLAFKKVHNFLPSEIV